MIQINYLAQKLNSKTLSNEGLIGLEDLLITNHQFISSSSDEYVCARPKVERRKNIYLWWIIFNIISAIRFFILIIYHDKSFIEATGETIYKFYNIRLTALVCFTQTITILLNQIYFAHLERRQKLEIIDLFYGLKNNSPCFFLNRKSKNNLNKKACLLFYFTMMNVKFCGVNSFIIILYITISAFYDRDFQHKTIMLLLTGAHYWFWLFRTQNVGIYQAIFPSLPAFYLKLKFADFLDDLTQVIKERNGNLLLRLINRHKEITKQVA